MATKTHIASQLVIIKLIPCQHMLSKPNQLQRGHEMQLKMCRPKSSNVCVDKKCISTCVEQSHSIAVDTQNAS